MESNIEKLKGRTIPPVLYHYTSQKGLLGIINNKEIWATNIYYLNDAMEFQYATELIRDVIDSRLISRPILSTTKENDFEYIKLKFLENVKEAIENFKYYNIFICSFSKEGDQLSQWRGYCPDRNCFSVAFQTSDLKARMKKYSFNLTECIYKKNEQVEQVEKIIDRMIEPLKSIIKRPLDKIENVIEEQMLSTIYVLISVMPRLKHESFHEEKEWRFFAIDLSQELDTHIKFREGKSMIIPYVAISLAESKEPVIIDHIIIGPTPHKELSLMSVQALLSSQGIKCNVKNSKTPYRTW